MINPSTKLYSLIGYPLSHSYSPLMHNAVFNALDINAIYFCLEIHPANFKEAVKAIKVINNLSGFNITIPYKEKIINYINMVYNDPGLARYIGAVNTVKLKNNKLYGYNTDSIGFIEVLKKLWVNPYKKKAAILGAGGAGKALAIALANENVSLLQLFDIDYRKSCGLKNTIEKNYKCPIKVIKDIGGLDTKNTDLLVNASPVGMHKNDPLPLAAKFLEKHMFVYDLVYNPQGRKTTLLVEESRKKGLCAYDGIWLLVYQGINALQIWFDNKFDTNTLSSIILKAFKKEKVSIN